jgi:hypothetical protein
LNSAATACNHCSSLSSSNKHTAAGFPLNAESVNASTCPPPNSVSHFQIPQIHNKRQRYRKGRDRELPQSTLRVSSPCSSSSSSSRLRQRKRLRESTAATRQCINFLFSFFWYPMGLWVKVSMLYTSSGIK